MKALRIAIVGAGTAGLATATFLAEDGHRITLFERFETPLPVGAGLLLQPVGLAVLARLGLDGRILRRGSRIERLSGRVAGKHRPRFDIRYSDLAPHLFGAGVHRGLLFSALFERMQQTRTSVRTGIEIATMESDGRLHDTRGGLHGPFDLVVDASGANSALRQKNAAIRLDRLYPFGVLWATVRLPPGGFHRDAATVGLMPDDFGQSRQKPQFGKGHSMIGVLPLGRSPQGEDLAAFIGRIGTSGFDAWRQAPIAKWKDHVAGFWPETAPLLAQLGTHEDFTFATYRNVVLERLHSGRLLFIGDAAHSTNPRLGQGANLALVDAVVLSEVLREADSLKRALELFEQRRRAHLRFYQSASRWSRPLFASESLLLAKLRFAICDAVTHFSPARRLAAQVLSGTKQGLFSSLDPGVWDSRYSAVGQMPQPSYVAREGEVP